MLKKKKKKLFHTFDVSLALMLHLLIHSKTLYHKTLNNTKSKHTHRVLKKVNTHIETNGQRLKSEKDKNPKLKSFLSKLYNRPVNYTR